jgi:hypothetical protein
MCQLVDRAFLEWTSGKNPLEARITIFEKIRDIPYAIIPEISNADNFPRILDIGKGSCTPKHLLLASMFERLGITVLLVVYPFRWPSVEMEVPQEINNTLATLPDDHHMACKALINERLVLVDATVDPALEKLGLPVNKSWDGMNDTLLAVEPSDEEMLFHPSEASMINKIMVDPVHIEFYDRFNSWLDDIREN